MLETIFLVRHGFRLSWESSQWNAPTGTPRDPPLSKYGVDQAHETATFLSSLSVDAIVSSPLYRCLETAAPLSRTTGLDIRVEFGLGEWYLPVKRGLHPRSRQPQELIEWFPTIDVSHPNQLYPTQRGETKEQVHDRAEEVLRLLIKEIEKDDKIRTAVFFTHAATNIACGRALVGDRGRDIRSGTCSIGTYNRIGGTEQERDGLGRWEMTTNGDCGHLSKGEEVSAVLLDAATGRRLEMTFSLATLGV